MCFLDTHDVDKNGQNGNSTESNGSRFRFSLKVAIEVAPPAQDFWWDLVRSPFAWLGRSFIRERCAIPR